MKPHQFIITREELDRHAAALFAWLVWAIFLVLRLGQDAHRSRRVKRAIARCERFVHAFLICTALARMRAAGTRRPHNTAPGLRAHKAHPRLLARSLRLRAKSFYARVVHLLKIFGNPEPYIARLARKLRSGRRFNLVLASAIAETLASLTPREIAGPDSS